MTRVIIVSKEIITIDLLFEKKLRIVKTKQEIDVIKAQINRGSILSQGKW
jgi:hypothetical protein